MIITKRQLPVYTDMSSLIGKYQYICESKKGAISLIELCDNFNKSHPYEIYCLEGKLFADTVRFSTQEEAMSAIRTYLD
jgi:hypothetical protein